MNTESRYILLDVGGTQIKCGLADRTGQLLVGKPLSFPAKAKEEGQVIFDNFAAVLKEMKQYADGFPIAGIGMAFPGPFEYDRGISLMQGLDKYDHIYGIPVVAELRRRIGWLKDTPVLFLHDVEAFAIGESWYGEAKDMRKLLCLCIGTGTGSAFIKDRNALKEEKDGVPLNGWIYHTPFKNSVIDDYLSARGLSDLTRKAIGRDISGKELYQMACGGDRKARAVFEVFGWDLKEAMTPFLDRFEPEAVIMGGQISKSFSFFGNTFQEACRGRNIKTYTEAGTSIRAMQGLFISMKEGV